MKTMLKGFLTLILALFVQVTFAQEKTVTGTVSDSSGPLPGVSVVIKGTTKGTDTDFNGKYSITVKTGDVLKFSYVGYTPTERKVESSNTINVTMSEDENVLDEIIINAIGLERKKDEDISSSTVIKTEKIARSGEPNLIQGLAGKTSGVTITQNTGDPGAGAYIQIRGQNTILGDSSPLIIVDGVPVSNSSFGAGTAGVVQQSRLNDIPASDIESVNVLKGAAAAAIWGTAAANGVVVITTKKGRAAGGNFSIEISSSLSVDEINREHEKQGIYGQGAGGSWSSNASGLSWGDKIANRSGAADGVNTAGAYFVGEQTGKTYYPITAKNSKDVFNQINRDQIFRTGITQNYSIGLSHSDGLNSNTYLGFARIDQEGIINGQSDYKRNTFRLNHSRKFSDWLTARVNSSYTYVNSNRIQTGSNLNGLYLGYLRTSPDFDNTDYSGTYYTSPTDAVGVPNSHRSYRNRQIGQGAAIYNNPGWTINKVKNPNTLNRFTITPELNIKFLDNLNLTARYGVDYYLDKRNTYFPVNSAGDFTRGAYYRDDYSEKIENFNLFFNGNLKFGEDTSLDWVLGYMLESNIYSRFSSSTNVFLNPDPDKQLIGNATNENILAEEFNSVNKKNGIYYSLTFGYKDLILETTARAERSTTVTGINFFPSVSLGYNLTNNLIKSDILSFAKLRTSYGQIGIEPQLYLSNDIFFSSTAGAEGWGDYLDGANYNGTVRRGAVKGNPNLNIEKITEFEIGGDFRLFQDKLSLGFTYYNRLTTDAILELELPASSGYSSTYENAAEISNKGVEVDFSYAIVNNQDWKVDIFGNWTTYKNIVEKLPNVSRYILNGFTSTSSAVVEGQPFGAIFGGKYQRDASGKIQLDADGFPLIDVEQGVIGDPNPDWRGGLGMSLAHKGFKFSFLFETSQGNDMWGGTAGVLKYFGTHPDTAIETVAPTNLPRYSGGFGGTIASGTTFRGTVADFGGGPVALEEGWYRTNGGGFGDLDEQFVQDASWTKLREVSLSYTLPEKFLTKTFMKSLEIGVSGRNLLLITDFEGVDPEVNLTGASKGRGLDYFTNPATRSFLFNIKIGI